MRRKHKAYCRKLTEGLFEARNEKAIILLSKIKINDVFEFSIDDDPSPAQHRTLLGYIGIVYDNQDEFKSYEHFKVDIKKETGWGKFDVIQKNGEEYGIFMPGSWKWKDIDFSKFNDTIFPNVTDYLFTRYGFSIDDYIAWMEKEKPYKICETQECFNPQQHPHEIFPGHGKRKICIILGLVVKICSKCHKAYHLETGSDTFREKHKDAYCRKRGYKNSAEALYAVNNFNKRSDNENR